MKKIWKIIIIIIVVIALVLLGLFIYDEFFYDDEYDNDDMYYDNEDDDEYYDEEDDYSDSEGDDEYYEEKEDASEKDNSSSSSAQTTGSASSSLTNLIILLNFEDQQLSTDESDWSDFYFGSGNSVKSYFSDMSKGDFEIIPAEESYGTSNNGVIEVTISRPHPNLTSESSDDEYDVLSEIFKEMLEEIDPYIDFSEYDINNDGNVLAAELSITMIAAGYEENDYSYNENQVSGICINEDYFADVDGVGVGDYILCGELEMLENGSGEMVTIGVACHETAHVLGLPDLYDTDYSSIGLGFHALMSEGNNNRKSGERLGETPSPLIAWSRMHVGFIEPQEVSDDGTYTLYGQSTNQYNVIKIDDGDGYYLIENVDFNGYGEGISEYMDHGGIAIWYINDSVVTEDNIFNNDINNDDDNRGVILMEAAGNKDLFEESLNYDNPNYNHYFAGNDIDEFTTENGTVIKILDAPADAMEIEITFGN